MRRRLLWVALPALGLGITALASPSGAAAGKADRTGPYGQFGFRTVGLGTGPSYGEPSLAMAPDGKHYAVSTPGDDGDGKGTVQVWHSADRGDSWKHTTFSSDNGGGDSELDFRPNGTLLGADLELGDLDNEIHISKDFGKTWNDQGSRAGIEADRQWFAHTSDGKRQFLAYHDIGEEAEVYVESNDGGKTWGQPQLVNDPSQATLPSFAVAPTSGDPVSIVDQGVNTFSGPMLVDKNDKDFYVVYSVSNFDSNTSPDGGGIPPFGAVRGLVVAHSGDAGKTWTNKYAVVAEPNPSDPSKEDSVGTMFPWGFLDPAGNLYIVYGSTQDAGGGTDHYGFYYVVSTDKGKTWSKATRIDGLPDGEGSIVFNTGAAVKTGVIDVAWLQKDTSAIGAEQGVWNPWFAQITGADTGHPHISRQKVTTLANHKEGVCILGTICLLPPPVNPGSQDRSLLDFIELSVNPKTGLAGLVYADNGGFRPGQGAQGEVVFAQQTVQPKIVGPKSHPVNNHPTPSGPAGDGGGGNGAEASPLPDTGSSPLLPITGALLLSAAAGVAIWRRRA